MKRLDGAKNKRRSDCQDLSGKQFGRWIVLSYGGNSAWECVCTCGTKRRIQRYSLVAGLSKSCGCARPKGRQWTIEQQRASRKKWRDNQPGYRARESRRWREKDPIRCKLRHRQTNYRIKYGLELYQVEAMFKSQDEKCAICNSSVILGGKSGAKVDHDHRSGRVRGILCSCCNTALGSFRDSTDILASAISYLEKADTV